MKRLLLSLALITVAFGYGHPPAEFLYFTVPQKYQTIEITIKKVTSTIIETILADQSIHSLGDFFAPRPKEKALATWKIILRGAQLNQQELEKIPAILTAIRELITSENDADDDHDYCCTCSTENDNCCHRDCDCTCVEKNDDAEDNRHPVLIPMSELVPVAATMPYLANEDGVFLILIREYSDLFVKKLENIHDDTTQDAMRKKIDTTCNKVPLTSELAMLDAGIEAAQELLNAQSAK
jgi:hypothetical protein